MDVLSQPSKLSIEVVEVSWPKRESWSYVEVMMGGEGGDDDDDGDDDVDDDDDGDDGHDDQWCWQNWNVNGGEGDKALLIHNLATMVAC